MRTGHVCLRWSCLMSVLALGACSAETVPLIQQPAGPSPQGTPDGSFLPAGSVCGEGDGGAVFGPPLSSPTGVGPWQLAVTDLNGDGKLDLVVANGGVATNGPPQPPGNSLTLLYGHGDGTFPTSVTVPTRIGTVAVVAADLDDDGTPDLAVGSCDESDGGVGGAVQLFAVQSNGLYVGDAPYPLPGCPSGFATADFNGDRRIDLAVASPGPFGGESGVIVLFNHGKRVIGPPILYPTAAKQNAVAALDLNGDGKPDLVSVGEDSTLTVLLNDGLGVFQQLAPALLPDGPYDSIATADFNRDGKLDVALVATNNGSLAVLLGRGDGAFDAPTVLGANGYPVSVVTADFNGDGLPDLATAYVGGFFDGVDLYLNQGKGVFGSPTEILSGGGSFGSAVGDFNGDGRPDLAVANNDQAFATVLLESCGAGGPTDAGPFVEAAHTPLPRVPDNGGPVLPAPQVVTIHYAGDPAQAHNEAFNDWIASSQWLAAVGASYGVAPGVDLAKVVLPQSAPLAMSDTDIQGLLLGEIDAGVLPAPTANDAGYSTSILYMLYLPAQTIVSSKGLGTSCQSFGGYHSEDDLGSVIFPYAVVPSCYNSQDEQDVAASHELIEAATDPFPFSASTFVLTDQTSPWAYVPGEVGDLCVGYYLESNGYIVQRIWSNNAAAAGTQPCVPAPGGPYFNVSPAPANTLQMKAGQTATFQLTGWSTEAMAPFGIGFMPIYYAATFGQGFFVPEATLDRLTLQNGEVANLSITIPASTPPQSFAPFGIYTGRDDRDENGGYWTFLITVTN